MDVMDRLCLGVKLCAKLCANKLLASARQCLGCAELFY